MLAKCYSGCCSMLKKCGVPPSLLPGLKGKPTIAIIPGAWQDSNAYNPLRDAFSSVGYQSVCLSPPSTTLPHGNTDLAADVTFVREKVLLPLINEGKDVIVLMHSFGGVYGGAATRGLSKAQREREAKKGGVVALVYMAAVCVPSGMSTLERMGVGEELLPWVELDKSTGLLRIPDPIPQMFHNLPAKEASKWAAGMKSQAIKPMQSTVEYAPFEDSAYKGKVAYLMCTDDQTFHLPSQKKFLSGANIETTDEMSTSHMPWLEKPQETVQKVLALAGKCAAGN